jgi:hypothetical protein
LASRVAREIGLIEHHGIGTAVLPARML